MAVRLHVAIVVALVCNVVALQTNVSSVGPSAATVTLANSETVAEPRLHSHALSQQKSSRAVPAAKPKHEPYATMFEDSDLFAIDTGTDPYIPDPDGSTDESVEDEYHYRKVWNVVKGVRRHKHKKTKARTQPVGVEPFFQSAVVYEWCIFGIALAFFVVLYYHLLDWPSTTNFHGTALLIWLALGGVYNVAVWIRLGKGAGVMWFTGYLLEFIFSIENVFVFHIVITAFDPPRRVTQKALFCVVCCQVVFEMIFFMGIAARVRSVEVLPYILGVWLLYVGFHAAQGESCHDEGGKGSSILRFSKKLCGARLSATYDDGGALFVFKDGQICMSLVLPLIAWLLAVDFVLEVDVTLTKIEELPNEYIAFTSSAAAAFAVPELFFVAQDLFQRYWLLQYGVSFVLMFFGVQMLFHSIFALPDLVSCAIIIVVMIICMLVSGISRPLKQMVPHPAA